MKAILKKTIALSSTQSLLMKNMCQMATVKMSVREALNSALKDEIERDEKVFLMGEEVAKYNGAYKISKGLYDKFGDSRIWDTPISEQGFTGIGAGAAMYGLKPVIEFMTFNFSMQAMDQIINSCAKGKYMSGGDLSCPIVFRGCNGPSKCVGASHSQCYASWFSNVPGLIVMAPYDIEDARGMLKAAIRDPNPVVFLESEVMYNEQFEADEKIMDMDFLAPIGKVRVMKEGKDVTIVGYLKALKPAIKAAQELEKQGISCEVINLRTIRPLDREGIIKSVKKTKHLVTVEEGFPQCGIGAEICALMMEFFLLASAFDFLDAPVERITAQDIPLPYSYLCEERAVPQVENVINAVKKTLNKK